MSKIVITKPIEKETLDYIHEYARKGYDFAPVYLGPNSRKVVIGQIMDGHFDDYAFDAPLEKNVFLAEQGAKVLDLTTMRRNEIATRLKIYTIEDKLTAKLPKDEYVWAITCEKND